MYYIFLLLIQIAYASIYSFSYPNINGLYDIIHYSENRYTVLSDPLYPNQMAYNILFYDYSYKTKNFYIVDNEGTLHTKNLDTQSYFKTQLEKYTYQLNYIENNNSFIGTIYKNNSLMFALFNSYSGTIIKYFKPLEFNGRALPLYGLSSVDNINNIFVAYFFDNMRIKIIFYDLNNDKLLKIVNNKFSIYINIAYHYIDKKIIGIKYNRGNLEYYEYAYGHDNYCKKSCYIFDKSLGTIQLGSSLDIYKNIFAILFKKDNKINVVQFDIIKKKIKNIIILPKSWNHHLLFYPGPISTVISAKFNNLGNQIDIIFDMDNLKTIDGDCELFFTRSSIIGIGDKGYCKWQETSYSNQENKYSNKLTIYTSNNAFIKPDQQLILKDNYIQSRYQIDTYSGGNFIITGANFTKPDVIIFGSNKLSICDSLNLDGSLSVSYDGRPFSNWFWSIQPRINYNYSNDKSELIIPPNVLNGDTEYNIKLAIISSLGIYSEKIHNIFISNKAVPQVKILGNTLKKSYFNRKLYITAEVTHAECIKDPKYKKLIFEWTSTMELDPYSKYTTKLYIPPKRLLTYKTYRFFITVYSEYDNDYRASTYTDVEINEDNVYAIINGGDHRVNPLSRNLNIDGSDSFDPDYHYNNNQIELSYYWYSYYDNEILPIENNQKNNLLIPANTIMINGTYTFCLDVFKSGINIKHDTKCVIVDYTVELNPRIEIKQSKQKFNANDKIILTSNSHSYMGESLTYEWQCINRKILRNEINTELSSFNLVIKPDVLTAGNTYTFMLTGVDSGGRGYSQINLNINTPPRGGDMTITPTTGVSMNTSFNLYLYSWTDDINDLPILYNFGTINNGFSYINTPNNKNRINTYLSESINDTTLVIGYIQDVYEGKVNVTSVIKVKPYQKPLHVIKNEIFSSINEYINTGDLISCVNTINTFINLVNTKYSDVMVMENLFNEKFDVIGYELYSLFMECSKIIDNDNDAYLRLNTLSSLLNFNNRIIPNMFYNSITFLNKTLDLDLNYITLNKTLEILDTITSNMNITNSSRVYINDVYEQIVSSMIKHNIPNEDPVNMKSDNINLLVQKKTVDNMKNMSVSDNVSVSIPENLTLGVSVVDLDLRDIKNNPYSSDVSVESNILSFTIKQDNGGKIKIENTAEPFRLVMNVKRKNGILPVTSCNYWNDTIQNWDSKGCYASHYENDNLICLCNHLTDFASNRPNYNAVDPVGDFSLLKDISWNNFTTIVIIADMYVILLVMLLCDKYITHRDNQRLSLLKSFNPKIKKDDFIDFFKKKNLYEVMQEKLLDNHHWYAIFNTNISNIFTRQLRILLVFCILMSALTSNALFFGTDNTSLIRILMAGLITSVIITIPSTIFLISIKHAINIEEKYTEERNIYHQNLKLTIPNIYNSRFINMKLTHANSSKNSSKIDFPYINAVIISMIIYMFFCSYLLILFGIKFSSKQADNWLITSAISTTSDIILMQPVQIIGKVFFLRKTGS